MDVFGRSMNVNGWEAMLFIGLNAAISVRVSNELGSGRPRAAKHAVAAVVAQSLAMGLVAMAVVLAYRNSFAALFTGDREMQAAVGKVACLLAATMVLNSVQPVISGVAIGGGWQALVAYINLGCYYAFGLPLGLCLGFSLRLGPKGIWAGMLCGTALQTAALLLVIWNTDWEAEAAQANDRIRAWGGDDDDCHTQQLGGGADLKEAFPV
jgi:MATE family multidrug resistance protein